MYKEPLEKSFVDILLSTSFMKSFSSNDTKLGHINEPVIMENTLKMSNTDSASTLHPITFVSQTGLIQNSVHEQMHASPDYIGIANVDGLKGEIFIEIKCRTRHSTALVEKNLVSSANLSFIWVIAGDENFHKNILRQSEKLQLLHQSATTGINLGLLLIGDKYGTLIRGIWVKFPYGLTSSYQSCVADIHETHFKFTSDALKNDDDPMSYIDSDMKKKIEVAIGKQTYVDWESFQYGFKMWVTLRKNDLPLLTSRKVVPAIASLWNRSKNGSDVATGMIRSAWFPLPTAARTPAALAVQRILYLIQINILKIVTFVTFGDENIDNFRRKTNRINGSFRTFGLKLREICIVPRLAAIHKSITEINELMNGGDNDTSLEAEPFRTFSTRRRLRSRTTYHINNPTIQIQRTGKTPSNRQCKEEEAAKRRPVCTLPLLVPLCDEVGIAIRGKQCDICARSTKFWCLGCHRHFCNDAQPDTSKFRKGIGVDIKGSETIASADLSLRSNKRKSPLTQTEIEHTTFKFTCHVRGHLHLLDRQDSSVVRNLFN